MKRHQIALTVILVISFIFSGFYGWQAWNTQRHQLGEARAKVVQIGSQFEEYKIQTGKQVENLQDELSTAGDKLNSAKKELEATESNLQNTETQLQIVQLELEAQEKHYEQKLETEREANYKTGYEQGYEEGKESVLPKKPTYAQAIEMSKRVQVWATSPNACTIVAMEARERWRKEGWKVGVASIRFWGIGGHLVVVFDTVDKDEVYLDIFEVDGLFREVKVEEGKSYTGQNGLPGAVFDDTIFKVITMW